MLNDCEPEERLDSITRDTAKLFKVPICMINLVTADSVVFKSCIGDIQGNSLKSQDAFCSVAALSDKPFVIIDTLKNPTFKNYMLVTGPSRIRSYIGKSLKAPDGSVLGTLCLLDTKPRDYSREQQDALCCMAKLAEKQLAEIFKFSHL